MALAMFCWGESGETTLECSHKLLTKVVAASSRFCFLCLYVFYTKQSRKYDNMVGLRSGKNIVFKGEQVHAGHLCVCDGSIPRRVVCSTCVGARSGHSRGGSGLWLLGNHQGLLSEMAFSWEAGASCASALISAMIIASEIIPSDSGFQQLSKVIFLRFLWQLGVSA